MTERSELMKNAAPVAFGLIILLGFFYVIYSLLTVAFPPENKDFIASLSKTLETILVMAIGFFFGSTSSSKAKDETISEIAKASPILPAPPPPAPPPIVIPDAETVTVATERGNINVNPEGKTK